MPSPRRSSRLPMSPRRRRNAVSATTQRSQSTSPSSSRRRTSAPACPAISVLHPDDLPDRVEGRPEQDDEHGREDQEDEREEDLDGRLLSALLGGCAATLPHLDSEVSHDLARRGAQSLSLEDGAYEGPHPRRVCSGQHSLQGLVGCQPHTLLLERQP